MNMQDVQNLMARDDAEQALYNLLREGLTNAVSIPEVLTDADQAAHHLLGCVHYMAMLSIYGTADDLRHDDANEDERAAADVVVNVADDQLRMLTKSIMFLRGPIGPHRCEHAEG